MKSVPLSTHRSESGHSRPANRPEMTRGSGCEGTAPQRVAAVAFLAYRTITRARQSRQADAFRLLTRMVQQNTDDLMMLCASSVAEETHKRRVVERALGAWRGSTISGYLRGDEQTYLENFRCSKQKFDAVVALLEHTPIDRKAVRASASTDWRKTRRVLKAGDVLDPPSLRYKVAVCLYAIGQGGPIKPLADACSIGKSTLRKYLDQFADGVRLRIKPIYMPCKPWSESERAAVQGNFASRRGLAPISLACDGSHLPFKPKGKKNFLEYRNFKGWTSILAVAFVDSYFRFFDVDVGYPGRAGDNTVLAHNWLMKAIAKEPDKWLGPGGVVLGDSGASDGDAFFLNPFWNPEDPEKLWFNFCHSSTRFFVEQAFGMWKSRFRFLLFGMPGLTHKLFVKTVYTSAILHNMFVVHSGDKVEYDIDEQAWLKFFRTFAAHRCPTCVREGKGHCIHQASHRNGAAQQKGYRVAPSEMRDAMCDALWRKVCDGEVGDRAEIETRMREGKEARDSELGF